MLKPKLKLKPISRSQKLPKAQGDKCFGGTTSREVEMYAEEARNMVKREEGDKVREAEAALRRAQDAMKQAEETIS
jgi:hypothetical protein